MMADKSIEKIPVIDAVQGHQIGEINRYKSPMEDRKGMRDMGMNIEKYAEEDSLSDEIFELVIEDDVVEVKKIQKAVRELKEELFKDPEPCCLGIRPREAKQIIDKIFGDKLI